MDSYVRIVAPGIDTAIKIESQEDVEIAIMIIKQAYKRISAIQEEQANG